MKKKLILVGPLPRDRMEGVSISFRTMVTGLRDDHIAVVNSNWMRNVESPGRFNVLRAIESLGAVLRTAAFLPRSRAVYLIVATSPFGFLRDALIVLLSSWFRRPVVGHLHGGGMRSFYLGSGRSLRWFIRYVYARVTTIIVLGERLRSQYRFARDTSEIAVVANGLPPDMQPAVVQDRTLKSPLRLLYLSNLTPSKGLADLIAALPQLQGHLDAELHVCGAFLANVDHGADQSSNDFAASLHAQIDELGIRDKVHFHGTVSGTEKTDMLRDADVLVLPTYYRWEGQPISIIEAQAWGLPVVTTDHRAIADTVIFGRSAEKCEARNPSSIAGAIRTITVDPATYAAYSEAAYKNYYDRFRMDIHIQNLRDVIEDAAAGATATCPSN